MLDEVRIPDPTGKALLTADVCQMVKYRYCAKVGVWVCSGNAAICQITMAVCLIVGRLFFMRLYSLYNQSSAV